MDFINKSIDEIEAELFLRSRPYAAQIRRIASVPGVTELSALFILSETGADMSVFESDRHLCSWAGLTPDNTLQFLREQGADPETLRLIQQQCAARAG